MAFVLTALGSVAVGYVAYRRTGLTRDLNVREGYAVVTLAWLAVGLAGAVPYLLTGTIGSPAAAFFESVSGFTTTGATVFADIENLPRGVLFWRAMTQWLGGMGIIVLGIAILPFLGVGGMQLFRAEVPGPKPERLAPRIRQTAALLWYVYGGLTALQAALYLLGGMSLFEAVTHSFTTLSTGGFSARNASLAAYDSPYIQYVTILFMYMAAVNFTLHYRALRGRPFSGRIRSGGSSPWWSAGRRWWCSWSESLGRGCKADSSRRCESRCFRSYRSPRRRASCRRTTSYGRSAPSSFCSCSCSWAVWRARLVAV